MLEPIRCVLSHLCPVAKEWGKAGKGIGGGAGKGKGAGEGGGIGAGRVNQRYGIVIVPPPREVESTEWRAGSDEISPSWSKPRHKSV